jgi:pimeloyl-ACP methyl ester carboxylesterase
MNSVISNRLIRDRSSVVLGGYSFGGVIGAYYVAQYPPPTGKQAVTDQRQCTEIYAAG